MRRPGFWIALVSVLALALPALAADKDKKTKDNAVDANTLANVLPAEVPGKLMTIPDAGSTFTVRIEYQEVDPKSNAQSQINKTQQKEQQELNRLAQLQQEALNARNPRDQARKLQLYQQELARLQQTASQAVKVVAAHKDVNFETPEDVKVRSMTLPEVFDDKGAPKKYTKEEIDKLKDPKLPGYATTVDQLKKGQTVKLYLVKRKVTDDGNQGAGKTPVKNSVTTTTSNKPATTTTSNKPATTTTTDKPASTTSTTDKPEYKIVVKSILIVADGPETPTKDKNK